MFCIENIVIGTAIVLCIIIVIFAQRLRIDVIGGSQLEDRIIKHLEDIVGSRFPTAHPTWLREPRTGKILELDGYNKDLKIAIEVQGPHHWKPNDGEAYEKYIARIERDQLKKELCAKHKVHLIIVDYRISDGVMRDYLRSRLYDIGFLKESPANYIKEVNPLPWKRGS